MKKVFNNRIFIFILGGIVFSSISVFAVTLLSSSNVSYSNTTSGISASNVQDAIDSLYTSVSNKKPTKILVKSGLKLTGNATVSCTGIDNYQSLTASDFYLHITKVDTKFVDHHDSHDATGSKSLTYSYNASTGVLSISYDAKNYIHSGFMEVYAYPTIDIYCVK